MSDISEAMSLHFVFCIKAVVFLLSQNLQKTESFIVLFIVNHLINSSNVSGII